MFSVFLQVWPCKIKTGVILQIALPEKHAEKIFFLSEPDAPHQFQNDCEI